MLGVQPVGVLGVLLRAKNQRTVTSVKAAMQALKTEAGFFIADDLFKTIIAEAGE